MHDVYTYLQSCRELAGAVYCRRGGLTAQHLTFSVESEETFAVTRKEIC